MDAQRLPLFPLGIVLFPGTIIPLHIFEPRYRQMVADVMDGDRIFGLVYHDPERSNPFASEEGRVGTVAKIRRHQPLPDGRSIILVRGVRRFRIETPVVADSPYFQAIVSELLDDPPPDPAALVARRKRSLALFRSVLQTLPHVPDALPSFDTEEDISFMLAAAVRMDPFWQQELLELRDETVRLGRLDPVFRAGFERWRDDWQAKA